MRVLESSSPTKSDLLEELKTRLGSRTEATWLLEEVVGSQCEEVSGESLTRLYQLVEQRRANVPLQYLLGHWPFREIDLVVDERALIPRPETEQVVEVALAELAVLAGDDESRDLWVADLGTGSGSIALSISAEAGKRFPQMRVIGSDIDRDALDLARTNLSRVGQTHRSCLAQVRFVAGDWFDALFDHLSGQIDLIVSNPPYVDQSEWPDLDPEVRHEPPGALVAEPGSDGTLGFHDVEEIVRSSPRWLRDGGVLVVEIASHHGPSALATAAAAGFKECLVAPDLAGRDRVLVARI